MEQSVKMDLYGHPELDAFLRVIPIGGLFSPNSVIWKISRERVILIGGPAAAILQVAHPSVGRGVAQHSNFRHDAIGRLLRTVRSIYAVTFGDREEVHSFATRIAMMHQMVRSTGADSPYSAFDPALQLWVTATLIVPAISLFLNPSSVPFVLKKRTLTSRRCASGRGSSACLRILARSPGSP